MDKKRKSNSSTTAPEANEQTESKKRLRSTKPELNISHKELDVEDDKIQDSSDVKEADCPEANVRIRTGLVTKRTKKPPKSLENFICRPSIRVFQNPELVALGICRRRDGKSSKTRSHHSIRRSGDTDAFVTNEKTPSTTSTEIPTPDSPLASSVTSLTSDSQSTIRAKKVEAFQFLLILFTGIMMMMMMIP